MGYGTVNTGYPVNVGRPNGVASLGSDGKVPVDQLPDLGFQEMSVSIPVEQRKPKTLYGLILADYGGEHQ